MFVILCSEGRRFDSRWERRCVCLNGSCDAKVKASTFLDDRGQASEMVFAWVDEIPASSRDVTPPPNETSSRRWRFVK
jgi:hypothetical protein